MQATAAKSLALYEAPGFAFAWAYAACCVWIASGFFFDAWAHSNVPVESIFTPYHAVFYGGLLALAALVAGDVLARRAHGYSQREWIRPSYRFSVLGFPVFLVAGICDLISHTLFGFEEGLNAVLSPTHLALGVGLFLLADGPVRAILARPAAAHSALRQAPLALALASWLILFHFGTAYAFDPAAGQNNTPPPIAPFTPEYLTALTIGLYRLSDGVLISIFQALAVTALLLWVVARIRLRPGLATLILVVGNVPAAAAFTNHTPLLAVTLAQSLVAGAVADWLIARYDPSPLKPPIYRVFAISVPLAYTGTYLLGTGIATGGLWWGGHIVLGTWLWSGAVGFALSLLGTAQRSPQRGNG
jgi:hypothetical protein